MVENIGQFADDDPEYESDAAADDDAEVAALVPAEDVPKDKGDVGEVGEVEALGDIG